MFRKSTDERINEYIKDIRRKTGLRYEVCLQPESHRPGKLFRLFNFSPVREVYLKTEDDRPCVFIGSFSTRGHILRFFDNLSVIYKGEYV